MGAYEGAKLFYGLTDQDVADRLGVNRSTFRRWKHNRFQTMELNTFGQMVRLLHLTETELGLAFGADLEE